MGETTVVIPIKSFRTGWSRLAGHLDDRHREALAMTVADRVVAAAGARPVLVVTDDDGVRSWAIAHGVSLLAPGGAGLDLAVDAALAHLRSAPPETGSDRPTRALIAHADLPLATDLSIADGAGDEVIIVTDRHDDGTNVLSIPLDRAFRVAYGVGSAARHRAQATSCGLPVRTIIDAALSWDLDTPDDLHHPQIQALLGQILGATP